MRPLSIGKDDRILIIAPHPDDECIGAGGIMCLYSENCSIWVLTDGAIGQGDMIQDKNRNMRKLELESEMRYAGIDEFRCFSVPDGEMVLHLNLLDKEDLSEYKYIFVTSKDDGHPDHKAACICVNNALVKQELETTVLGYEVHSPIKNPTHYIDISDVIDEKKKLISFHKSQNTVQRYDDMAVCLSEYRGHQYRMSGKKLEVYEEIVFADEKQSKVDVDIDMELQKQRFFYRNLTSWLRIEIDEGSIKEKLIGQGFRDVAIYGYAELGKLLFKEIKHNIPEINVVCVLDKKGKLLQDSETIPVVPNESLAKPDAVIVTTALYVSEIRKELQDIGYVNVVSLQEILDRR